MNKGKKATLKSKSKHYITGFDGLRTIGVFLVIFYHLNPNWFYGGYFGVPIFMVISGYLITNSLLNELHAKRRVDFRQFFLKRAKRLYPALITMLFATSSYIVLFQKDLLAKLWQIVLTNLAYVYNWWEIFNGQSYFDRFSSNESPFTHLWTLSIEGQFYLIWPFLLVIIYRKIKNNGHRVLITLGLAGISAILMAILYNPNSINRVYYGTDTRAFSILLGCALAMVWPTNKLNRNLNRDSKLVIDTAGIVSFIAMLVLFLTVKDQSPFLYRFGMLLFSIFTTILVAAVAHPGGSLNKILTNPFNSYVGKISYGIYIYQFPVMIFFENKVRTIMDHPILYPLIEIGLIFAISSFSYYCIEQYFAKITWQQFKKNLLLTPNKLNNRYKVGQISLALFIIVGLSGNAISVFAKGNDANDSSLAKKIKQNTKLQKKHNLLAEKAIKKANASSEKIKKNKSLAASLASSQSKEIIEAAKKHPVNQQYEKYGLSQIQLQIAQRTDLTAIGDSVMVDSQNTLTQIFPKILVDAKVSRQATELPDLLQQKADQGLLAPNILVGLGTNGTINNDIVDRSMQIITNKRQVFWLTVHVPTRPWQDSDNQVLQDATKRYSNLHLIDWHNYSKDHKDWFYDDLIHPNQNGSVYYGTFIAKNILQFLGKK